MNGWSHTQPLPYVHGGRMVYVTMSAEGLAFRRKGDHRSILVPWANVLPWTGLYVGAEGDPIMDRTFEGSRPDSQT